MCTIMLSGRYRLFLDIFVDPKYLYHREGIQKIVP
jgi:hypothetical protein